LPTPSQHEAFDYVIVGAGSSGATLAARLSENPKLRVLLLEAGPASHPLSFLPLSYALFMEDARVNWRYRSARDAGMNNRRFAVPRGRVVGGSSTINGMLWVRGQPLDFDTWAQMGNPGWSWADIEPLYRRVEGYEAGDGAVRGRGGPVRISQVAEQNPLYAALFEAAGQTGLGYNPDYNGAVQEGAARVQASLNRGRRVSVADAYLKPARGRANLKVVSEAQVEALTFDGARCAGVSYRQGGEVRRASAAAEVVLSAGAIGTPQILELSGIGDPAVMAGAGVQVRHALPGVGQNLRDHLMPFLQWKVRRWGMTFNERTHGLRGAWELMRYALAGQGYLAQPAAMLVAFLRSRPELQTPDIQLSFMPISVADMKKRKLHDYPAMTMGYYQMRPESRGSTHIQSASVGEAPEIRFNYLTDPIDRRAIVDGFRATRRLVEAPALDDFRGELTSPSPDVQADDEILDYVRRTAGSSYHPIGSCRMGPGPDCVVDAQLRVHGLQGLRIADASIMPTMPSGNTNAACIMIGEKAFDLISGGQ